MSKEHCVIGGGYIGLETAASLRKLDMEVTVLETYNTLPWFWSDQYDLKLQIAGLSQGFDEVDAVNCPKEFMSTKRALATGRTATPAQLAGESVNITKVFTSWTILQRKNNNAFNQFHQPRRQYL